MSLFAIILALCAATASTAAAATVPTTTDDIIVAAPGSYLPLFNPGGVAANPTYAGLARMDNETLAGMLAAFHAVNKAGGISHAGRKIRTIPVETFGGFSTFKANRTASEDGYWAAYANVTTAIARPASC